MNLALLQEYDALLFDLDGTLADSMFLHNQAWIETLKEVGCHISVETLREFAGVPNEKSVEIFNARFGWSLDPDAIAIAKENRFLKVIDQVKIIEPVHKIAREHHQMKKPLALVTGGTREIVVQILRAIKSEDMFSVRVCAGDVKHGKPAPDPFLHAAKLLKVAPEKCLVFEDGQAGIDGAKAAGMGVVKVAADFTLSFT